MCVYLISRTSAICDTCTGCILLCESDTYLYIATVCTIVTFHVLKVCHYAWPLAMYFSINMLIECHYPARY